MATETLRVIEEKISTGLTALDVDPSTAGYIYELVDGLPDERVDQMMKDIERFETTGILSMRVEKLLRRAKCLADADRINYRYSAGV